MLPLSRLKDVKEIDEREAHEGWVPGWNPHLDIWHTLSSLARNQVRLAQTQVRLMKHVLFLTVMWLLVMIAWVMTSCGVSLFNAHPGG